MLKLLIILLLAASMSAQENPDRLVTVPARYVSTDGLAHQAAADVSKWVGVGREIGIATKEGLSAVVDEAGRFGTTKVGTFIMTMVAWKIIGHQLLAVVVGIPLFLFGVWLWSWSFRGFFRQRRVLVKHDGKLKEWSVSPPYKFESGDARAACGWAHLLTISAWSIAWVLIIFV